MGSFRTRILELDVEPTAFGEAAFGRLDRYMIAAILSSIVVADTLLRPLLVRRVSQ